MEMLKNELLVSEETDRFRLLVLIALALVNSDADSLESLQNEYWALEVLRSDTVLSSLFSFVASKL